MCLAVLVGLALLLRLAILHEFVQENPIAEQPWTDGAAYWLIAGAMAAGQWVSDEPFLFAPLYPYLLGVLRASGGGLLSVCIVQLLLHLITAVLIAWVAQLRTDRVTGLVAAGLFLALTEPAVSSTRVLASTLQLLLVALLWWRWVVLAQTKTRPFGGVIGVGCLIGLLALAYPAAMLLVPAYGLWLWWTGSRGGPALARGAAGTLGAILFILPATFHNAAKSGEFIPITAHGGITLRQGNGPAAHGVYTTIAGVSPNRLFMHESARQVYEQKTGEKATWGRIDAHFRNETFAYWMQNPWDAGKLFALKAYWFLTSRNYDDISPAMLEREYGVGKLAMKLAPLATPYLMGAALAGVFGAISTRKRWGLELFLIAVPLITTILFFYSPRYRLPAIPVLCGLAAYAFVHVRRLGFSRIVVVMLWLVPVALLWMNTTLPLGETIFDSKEIMRDRYSKMLSSAQVHVGDLRITQDRPEEAMQRYQAALRARGDNANAHRKLGFLQLIGGDVQAAGKSFGSAVSLDPADPLAYRHLYNIAGMMNDAKGARFMLELLRQVSPDDGQVRFSLAWLLATCPLDEVRDGKAAIELANTLAEFEDLDKFGVLGVRAAAYAEAGDFEKAIAIGEQSLELARETGDETLIAQVEVGVEAYRQNKPMRAGPLPLSAAPPIPVPNAPTIPAPPQMPKE